MERSMIRSRERLEQVLSAGSAIRREFLHDPEPRTIWSVAETGETIRAPAANWFLQNQKLEPLEDGLFPGESQTFVAA
jgi:hypothetical protein